MVEVYSCFPAAVRVQQRALGLDPTGPPTVTGGMAFAGGPFNNFVLQSIAEVVPAPRAGPDVRSGGDHRQRPAHQAGAGVWSAPPDGRRPLLADLAYEAAR